MPVENELWLSASSWRWSPTHMKSRHYQCACSYTKSITKTYMYVGMLFQTQQITHVCTIIKFCSFATTAGHEWSARLKTKNIYIISIFQLIRSLVHGNTIIITWGQLIKTNERRTWIHHEARNFFMEFVSSTDVISAGCLAQGKLTKIVVVNVYMHIIAIYAGTSAVVQFSRNQNNGGYLR